MVDVSIVVVSIRVIFVMLNLFPSDASLVEGAAKSSFRERFEALPVLVSADLYYPLYLLSQIINLILTVYQLGYLVDFGAILKLCHFIILSLVDFLRVFGSFDRHGQGFKHLFLVFLFLTASCRAF